MCKATVARSSDYVQRYGCTKGVAAWKIASSKQILINAPLERVWELVSQPGWWVPSTTTAPVSHTPGHQIVRESAKWGRFPIEVVRVEPRTYAAFRWASQAPGAELTPSNTTLVEFRLTPLGDAVRVNVVESGFAALPEDVREHAWKDNADGWQQELASLKERTETR